MPLALAGEHFEIDFAALEAALTTRTRLVLLTSPSNPLGWVAASRKSASGCSTCARERGLWLVADEVYERIYYGGGELRRPCSLRSLRLCDPRRQGHVVLRSLKSYCMTGWRVGWLV